MNRMVFLPLAPPKMSLRVILDPNELMPMTNNTRSYRSVLFGMQIRELGAERFSDWLAESFHESRARPIEGWFHYDEEESFGIVFANIVPELTPEESAIASKAVKLNLARLDIATSDYEGIFNLSQLAEVLTPAELLRMVEKVVATWLANDDTTRRFPSNANDVYFIREIMESTCRVMCADLFGRPTEHRSDVIEEWAHDFTVRRWDDYYEMTAALAPIYLMAKQRDKRCGLNKGKEIVFQLLESTLCHEDRFPEFYTWTYQGQNHPDYVGSKFAYDLDPLIRMGDRLEEIFRMDPVPTAEAGAT
jgi:hypothetical protein